MRRLDYSRRLRFIELALSNTKNADIMKEFDMSIQGVKWWLGTIYKELGVNNRKALINSRSKFFGSLDEFITYREKQARLNQVEVYVRKEPSMELPKKAKARTKVRKPITSDALSLPLGIGV